MYYDTASTLSILDQMHVLQMARQINYIDTRKPKTRKTGVAYPHSSDRQRARYARQIASGQIRNA